MSINPFYCKAINCGDPTSLVTTAMQSFLSGSALSTATYLAYTQVKCIVGYRWADESLTKNITCEATSFWTAIPPCISLQLI